MTIINNKSRVDAEMSVVRASQKRGHSNKINGQSFNTVVYRHSFSAPECGGDLIINLFKVQIDK